MTETTIPLDLTKPTWQPIWLACKACGHEWDDWQPAHVPIETWVAHVKTYNCPNCGKRGRHILLRARPLDIGFGAP